MGLKTIKYEIPHLGIVIPEAYAKINNISINEEGYAMAQFYIQQSREDMNLNPFKVETIRVKIDKDLPIYSQVYTLSKETTFKNWEDDIVTE